MTTTSGPATTPQPDVFDSVERVPAAAWDALAGERDIDQRHAYLRFREHLEPGASAVAVATDESGAVVAALPGTLTCDLTALFSHPWKLLTSDQFLRGDTDEETADLRAQRSVLLAPLLGGEPIDPEWKRLSATLGSAYVVRGYDSSEGLAASDAAGTEALGVAISAAQGLAHQGRVGAVVLPYVRSDDQRLRDLLAEAGFRSAIVTAASEIDTRGATSIDDFLAGVPQRRRYQYRSKMKAFVATGHTATTLDPAAPGTMEAVVAMELSTMARHGSGADPQALAAARRFLARHASHLLRLPAAADDEGAYACGVHLVGQRSYLTLTFGSDYRHGVDVSRNAYHHVTYHDPVAFSCANGISRIRLGFEAFYPKVTHAATVHPRETWFWTPDSGVLDLLAAPFEFLSARSKAHLAQYTS